MRKLLLLISILFSIIVLLAYSGRANIVILLLALLFYKNVLNDKIFMSKSQLFKYIIFIGIFGVISAFYRPFMLMLSGREIVFDNTDVLMSTWTSIVKAFSVPIISMMVAIEKFNFTEISLGSGALQIFLDIIPKSIIDPERIYLINNLNTELFGYTLDSRNYNINAGLLAYFYYEFHWFGVVIGSSITALIIKLFNDLLWSFKSNPTYGLIMVYFLLNLPHRILAGDQVGGFKSYLILIIEFLVLFFYAKSISISNSKIMTEKGYKIAAKVK
ncbi:oligosaccharide repeat unit polymerase [Pseudalkalibacillus sp. NRS-1564]|uniref:oligosaccharide repeat unit polymerase n=1 Tax=Pseudalkalibacillus sp. NRS-1564 TaxID=3233900 RepID=UPI003D285F09